MNRDWELGPDRILLCCIIIFLYQGYFFSILFNRTKSPCARAWPKVKNGRRVKKKNLKKQNSSFVKMTEQPGGASAGLNLNSLQCCKRV